MKLWPFLVSALLATLLSGCATGPKPLTKNTTQFAANNNGTNIVEGGKTNAWTYDAYDRASTYRDANGNLIQYQYDGNGNLTGLVYPGNRTVTYAYDNLNRLTTITDWVGRQSTVTYGLAGRVTRLTRPNNTIREINYDQAGQTTNIVEKFNSNFPIAYYRFNWDDAGRAQWEFGAPLPHAYTPPTRLMIFDADNRLATFNMAAVSNDLDGNLTYAPLTNSVMATYSYDARNRLLSVGGVTNTYDPAGNRVRVGTATLEVNPNAKLPQVLMRTRAGVTTYYVYGLGLLYEVDETATSTNTLTYHYDYRGSTVALTDDNGNVTDRIEYSAYGMTTYRAGTNDTPFLFNGRYGVMTDANGLLCMGARFYNPYLCRFISADPSGFSGGLNFFAYANGNPVSYVDPFGLNAGATGDSSSSWLSMAGSSFRNNLLNGATFGGYGLYNEAVNKYVKTGYAEENGAFNTFMMLIGESAGTTTFAEGWYGTDIGYGTSLSTFQSRFRMVTGGATMASWVVGGGAATKGFSAAVAETTESRALVPMSENLFANGTSRTVAGYHVYGNAGLIGDTYNVNVLGLYAQDGSQGLRALSSAFKAEAKAAGASRISISGNTIINPSISGLNSATAQRFGFQLQSINSQTIILNAPIP